MKNCIIITGGAGFIGSNLAKKLFSYQAKVFGIYSRNNKNLKFLMGEDYKKISLVKKNVYYFQIRSDHGHDAFFIEYDQISSFLERCFK